MLKYRKKQLIELVKVNEDGIWVQNQGNPDDVWLIDETTFEATYEKVSPVQNTVTQDQINSIIAQSELEVTKWGDKTTIVKAKLPNGFIIVESSSCVDPANFDEVIGYEICMERIANKIWELEGYALQKKVYENGKG